MALPFLSKVSSLFSLFNSRPASAVGVDIGMYSTKVVELKYTSNQAILQSYGEISNEGYAEGPGTLQNAGLLRFTDDALATLLHDVMREANIASRDAVFSVPAVSSFVLTVTLPPLPPRELQTAIPLEARKYIPVPLSEVVLEWTILENGQRHDIVEVLLVAVQREIVEKIVRAARMAKLRLRTVEVETFSMVRSLIGNDPVPTAIMNIGYQTTTLAIADRTQLRVSHHLEHGSQELTQTLAQGLGIAGERAEQLKREVGIQSDIEKREVAAVMVPHVEKLFLQIEQLIRNYNRSTARKIQRINLTGSGANLKGIIDAAAIRFGVETVRGDPFGRVITPPPMQTVLREIGPSFSVATGLALREMTRR